MATAPTVARLRDRVHALCGLALAEVGLLFRAVDEGGVPITPAVDEGLQIGMAQVGIALADGLTLTDDDLLELTSFGVRRVLLHAQIEVLGLVIHNWWRAVKRYEDEPMTATAPQGGWLVEERRGVQARLDKLIELVSDVYREPSTPMVLARDTTGSGWIDSTDTLNPTDCGTHWRPFGAYSWGWY